MNFVGKILVVFQLVLSVIFMAMAGAVYSAHMNWRTEALKQKATAQKNATQTTDKEQELEKVKRELTAKVTEAEQQRAIADAANRGFQQEVDRLKKENGDLQVGRKTAGEQAIIASEEAAARNDEAASLRKINHELTSQRDADFAVRIQLEDKVHGLQTDFDAARVKHKELLSQLTLYQQALEAAGITADAAELASKQSAPPRVDGKIVEIKTASRIGAGELVKVSLGSDDGLKSGHEMTVYRAGLSNGQKARYLARIKIVSTDPDESVGQVIESSRNGVIQKGDNVSTKL